MNRFADKLALIAVTLWVGGLWAIGYLAAPVLFSALADKTHGRACWRARCSRWSPTSAWPAAFIC